MWGEFDCHCDLERNCDAVIWGRSLHLRNFVTEQSSDAELVFRMGKSVVTIYKQGTKKIEIVASNAVNIVTQPI